MRNASNVVFGTTTLGPLGMDGGGWCTGIDIATDGYLVVRPDTGSGACVRGPSDTTWRQLFKPGVTYPSANQLYRNPAQNCYEVAIAPSNSLVIYCVCMGRMWKTTDRGFNWTLQTGFKSNTLDTSMAYNGNAQFRIGGQHMRVSPTVPNNVGFVHPVDGLYYSTDGGTTWTLSASVLAPTDTRGGNVHFVSDTDVWVTVYGRLPYRSTTGIGGTFSAVTGGPTQCSAMAHGGGKVYLCGDGAGGDTQVYVYNGTTWATPSSAVGDAIAVNPTTTSKVILSEGGGAMWTSTDTGVSFARTTPIIQVAASDVPYLANLQSDGRSIGGTVYDPTQSDRLWESNGTGVRYCDNPPISAGSPQTIVTKGIRQLLPQGCNISPNGTIMIPTQDLAGMLFTRANARIQAATNIPDRGTGLYPNLRMGTDVDYARDDESYLAMVYNAGTGTVGSISTNAGVTWSSIPTIPTFTHDNGNATSTVINYTAGNLAISNKLNMMWVSSNSGGILTQNAIKYTTDGGTTWLNPNFSGTNMTGASFHDAYYLRRHILQAYKGAAGVFYVYCYGDKAGSGTAADLAQRGVWKSTDGGANFTRIKVGHFGADYFNSKLRLNNSVAGHAIFLLGGVGSYPSAPSIDGIYFTANDWATQTTLTGWADVDDIAFGAKAYPGQTYQTLYAIGFRTGVTTYGLYRSLDFDPANPTACTWTLLENYIMGRPDNNNVMAADPTVFGRVVIGIDGGGGAVGDNVDLATGT